MDGDEGLTVFEKEKPDLVLLDIAMPKKSGFEVLETIRIDMQSAVPVFILSNSKDEEMIDKAEKLGIDEYLLKAETSLESLLVAANEILNKS